MSRGSSHVVASGGSKGGGRGLMGEVEALSGLALSEMGSRVERARPAGESGGAKRAAAAGTEVSAAKRLRRAFAGDDAAGYHPSTRETAQAWEELLNNVSVLLGDDEQSALRDIAEELMKVFVDGSMKEVDKKALVDNLLERKVGEDYFRKLLTLSKRLTDYKVDDDEEGEDVEGGGGGGAVFAILSDDEDDESMSEDSSEVSDEGEEGGLTKALDEDEGNAKGALDAKDIDAYWIQREMPKLSADEEAQETQHRADKVFDLLCDLRGMDEDKLETALIMLFSYHATARPFVDLCLANRPKIAYCMRLARAKGTDRDAIVEELKAQEGGAAIWDELHAETKKDDAEQREFRQQLREQQKERAGDKETSRQDRARAVVPDLDDLKFDAGERTMTNAQFKFPEGSQRIQLKGYEEIHVPAFEPRGYKKEDMIPVADMPAWSHSSFEGITDLNPVQSRCYNCAFERSDNMLLCAPTGAGKTNVAMLSILHEVSKCVDPATGELDEELLLDIKIVYVAPMKALVQEVVDTFTQRLKGVGRNGLRVSELTGDSNMSSAQINASQMIVSTPEKWDIITRKSGEKTHMQNVKLIIIDEIHLLHDTRGPVLEAIVARTLRLVESTQEPTRLVGLSATLPNYEDVATFLRVKKSDDHEKNGLLFFDGTYRPIPLEQQYIGISEKKPLKRRAIMNDIVYKKVMEVTGKDHQQCMIFAHSRKDTAATAKAIRDKALEEEALAQLLSDEGGRKEILCTEAEHIKDPHLRNLLPYGFGIHHAGLCREDRQRVETLFKSQHIQVLVCTATLAWGVNLPAYCVIIKGTQVYSPEKSKWTELSSLDVMQMIGRAGRLDRRRNMADQKGLGIIITGQSELKFYLSLLNQQLPIESHFISRLIDQLNAEIVMGSVQDRADAIKWLAYTYLYIRMLRKPDLYKVSKEELESDKRLEERREGLIHKAAVSLEKAGMIKYDRRTGVFTSTDLGRVCSYYYLTTGTVMKFNEHLSPTLHEIDMFRLFAMADEFKYMSVREEEKLELTKLLEMVPVPVKEDVDNPLSKVNVLLQAYISQSKMEGFSIMSDMVYIKQSATRVIRAMFEIVLKKGWASLADKLLNLAKMVEKRIWLSQSPLRQFDRIPLDLVRRLERKNISWDRYQTLSTNDLHTLLDDAKVAKQIYRCIHMVPKMTLEASAKPITRSLIRVELVVIADFQFDRRFHNSGEAFHIIVEDPDGEKILHHEPFLLKEQNAKEEHILYFYLPMFDPLPPQYFIKIVSDRWLWSETSVPLSFKQLMLPEKAAPHTELVDSKPHAISVLNNKKYEQLYTSIDHLNNIQTQAFHTLYNTDDNTLLCAPSGSGKTLCAEIALLRLFAESGSAKQRAVYVAPRAEMVDIVFQNWSKKFEKLGKAVVRLTGDTLVDLQLLEAGDVVLGTVKQWDVLSRRWLRRENVKKVKLFIVDELHHLDTMEGPTMEIITSRMRYIGTQKGYSNRILVLAHSLLHAREVGKWIGATDASTFNFHPTARPVTLQTHIRSFDQAGFSARTLAMYKPTFLAIKQYAADRPVLVFVPSKRVAFQMVKELVECCVADADPQRFVHCDEKILQSHTDLLSDARLKKSVGFGIAYYDHGMSTTDELIVTKLFDSEIGALQVMVVPYDLAYKVNVRSYMTILAGTQYYDGKERRHVDYMIGDMLEMLGKTGRPGHDSDSLAYLMCHTPKKEALKKVLYSPYPVESQLEACFVDHLNAEIVAKTIQNQQGAVDYLTQTFLYRRLQQNPNYYRMDGTSHFHMNDFLSRLVEGSVDTLTEAGCITVEEEQDEEGEDIEVLEAANLGQVAAYYYITYLTIEMFASSVDKSTNIRKFVEIVSNASEFSDLIIRHREDDKLERLSRHVGIKQKNLLFNDPHTKASLLFHAHYSRKPLSPELDDDLRVMLPTSLPLVHAMVDVVQTNRWLQPLLACMEVSQMMVQGMWEKDSVFLQLPHVSRETADAWHAKGLETIGDIMELEDEERAGLFEGMTKKQVSQIAAACNVYPDIEVDFEVLDKDDLHEEGLVSVKVVLTRDLDEGEKVAKVHAPHFPQAKEESWWLVIGDEKNNFSHAVKKLTLPTEKKTVKVEFTAPKQGAHDLTLFFMSDSYIGADQDYKFKINVQEPEESDEEDEEMEED